MLRKKIKAPLWVRFFIDPLDKLVDYSIRPKSRKTLTWLFFLILIPSWLPYPVIYQYPLPHDLIINLLYWQGLTFFFSNLFLPIRASALLMLVHLGMITILPSFVPGFNYLHITPILMMLVAVFLLTYAFTKLKKFDMEKIKDQLKLLNAKQARIDNLLDNEFYGIVVHKNQKIREINNTFNRILGHTSNNVVGHKLFDIIAPQDREEFEKRLSKEKNFYIEVMGLRQDGTFVPLEIISKHYNESGNDLEICFIRDITTRRAINEELENQKNYLQKILDAYPHALYIVDAGGLNIQAANEIAHQEKRAGSFPKFGFMAEKWSENYDNAIAQVKRTKKPVTVEQEYLDAEENTKVVEIHTYPFLNKTGEITQMVETIIDITARKMAEKKLKKALHELKIMNDALDEHAIVAITDTDGKITYVNDKFIKVSQFTREELMGKDHRILNSGYHPRSFFTKLWNTISSGKIWQGEIKNRAKDNSFYWVFSTIVPFLNESGIPYQYVSIRTDITNQKFIEEELKRAKEEAENANRAKSSFLANMSHEIRTPLNAILGMADLTRDTSLNSIQTEYINLIQSSGENLLYLINEILDFSKIEAGKLDIDQVEFSLRKTVRSALQIFFYQAREKQLHMTLSVERTIPGILIGDPGRIKQILINLLGNSIKFTERGFIDVIVKHEKLNDREILLKFSVRDSGIGISKEKLHLIFESFTQEDSSTTRKYGGTGLGTTISKQLAEFMGGKMGAGSPINDDLTVGGPGSEFWFTLKCSYDKKQPEKILNDLARKKLHAAFIGIPADDEKTALQVAQELNIETELYPSCKKFYEHFNQRSAMFDLILSCDPQNEIELRNHLNLLQDTKRFPKEPRVILITHNDSMDDSFFLFESSIDEYIHRPIEEVNLKRAIYSVFSGLDEHDSRHKNSFSIPEKAPKRPVQEEAQPTEKKYSILVAEDNEINQILVRKTLEKNGCEVTIAPDGQETVNLLKANPGKFDLIFMDLQMPHMNGFQASEEIRANISQEIPIVAVTANAFKEDIDKSYEAGMNAFIAKPYSKDTLLQAIEKWVKK